MWAENMYDYWWNDVHCNKPKSLAKHLASLLDLLNRILLSGISAARVNVVFDEYRNLSIKNTERNRKSRDQLLFWKLVITAAIPVFFHMKVTASVCKKLASRSWPVLSTLTYIFSYKYTLLFCWKIKSCCHRCFRQLILMVILNGDLSTADHRSIIYITRLF